MNITEVRIKLMEEQGDRLRAFCSITFDDCFVIRDLKIIEGSSGPFVAMPSRKLTSHCPQCGSKNHLRAGYCNQCGLRLKEDQFVREQDGRAKLYADIAHPINSACREMIQQRVIEEFHEEIERSKSPGYSSRYDDYYEDDAGPEVVTQPQSAPSAPVIHVVSSPHEPRAPHKVTAETSNKEDPPTNHESGGFGAGIF